MQVAGPCSSGGAPAFAPRRRFWCTQYGWILSSLSGGSRVSQTSRAPSPHGEERRSLEGVGVEQLRPRAGRAPSGPQPGPCRPEPQGRACPGQIETQTQAGMHLQPHLRICAGIRSRPGLQGRAHEGLLWAPVACCRGRWVEGAGQAGLPWKAIGEANSHGLTPLTLQSSCSWGGEG